MNNFNNNTNNNTIKTSKQFMELSYELTVCLQQKDKLRTNSNQVKNKFKFYFSAKKYGLSTFMLFIIGNYDLNLYFD